MDFGTQIFDRPGYSTAIGLEPDELATFQQLVGAQWIARIAEVAPEHRSTFEADGIQGYHRHAHLVDHRALWPKQHRVLPTDAVSRVLDMGVMVRLRDALGPFRIAEQVWDNRVQPDTHEVYWRLVRPDQTDDVGPAHRDSWFHENVSDGHGQFGPDEIAVKLWIALHTESGRNGLLVVPDSHRADITHASVAKDGVLKPQIGQLPADMKPELVPATPGTIVAFGENLIHQGAVNRGQTTRVSAEITLVLPRRH